MLSDFYETLQLMQTTVVTNDDGATYEEYSVLQEFQGAIATNSSVIYNSAGQLGVATSYKLFCEKAIPIKFENIIKRNDDYLIVKSLSNSYVAPDKSGVVKNMVMYECEAYDL